MSKLYTLYAVPTEMPGDFVMVASLVDIEQYLGRQVPRTFGAAFRIDHSEVPLYRTPSRVGYWVVVEGARLPAPLPVGPHENIGSMVASEEYLSRFPEEHRASADLAYVDGYLDGISDAENK